ncbi:MAG TPA: SteA domain-containing protein, partial [Solirubrobacteraceae bacterium]
VAAEKGAELIVAVGSHFNLVEFLEKNRSGMSSTFLTRLRIGEILVDAKGVSRLYRPSAGRGPLVILTLAALVALVVIIVFSPSLGPLFDLLWLKLQILLGLK